MKEVDLNFKVINPVDGQPADEEPLGKIVAKLLLSHVLVDEKKILKYYGWAVTLAGLKPLELDEADLLELKEFILKTGNISVLAKGQLIPKLK